MSHSFTSPLQTRLFQWHSTGYTTWWVKNECASIYDALLSTKSSFGLSEAADDVIWACNHRRCNYSWCLCEVGLTGLAIMLHVTAEPPDHKTAWEQCCRLRVGRRLHENWTYFLSKLRMRQIPPPAVATGFRRSSFCRIHDDLHQPPLCPSLQTPQCNLA